MRTVVLGLLACSLVTSGCRFLRTAPIVLSLPRSPVTIHLPEVNEPLSDAIASQRDRSQPAALPAGSSSSSPEDAFDLLSDLASDDCLVLVALSGGGARAASMACHVMAQLEARYNLEAGRRGLGCSDYPPFIDHIDAISSVSGGSLYAAQLAAYLAVSSEMRCPPAAGAPSPCRHHIFNLTAQPAHLWQPWGLGYTLGFAYLSPATLYLPLASTLTTNITYMRFLAHFGHATATANARRAMGQSSLWPRWAITALQPESLTLGGLPAEPRFLFNTTILENGQPLVLTQRMYHLYGLDDGNDFRTTSQLDVILDQTRSLARQSSSESPSAAASAALNEVLTLEDIGSSPARFPLAHAAAASAAYPVGLQPVEVRVHSFDRTRQRMYPTAQVLHLADAGIYDNSGLSTLLDFLESVLEADRRQTRQRRVLILYVNADVETHDLTLATGPRPRRPWYDSVPPVAWFDVGLPWRSPISVDALALIHFANKRRVEELVMRRLGLLEINRLKELERINKSKNSNLPPVKEDDFRVVTCALAQILESDRHRIPVLGDVASRVAAIPTHYAITEDQHILLGQAVDFLLNQPQTRDGAQIKSWAETVMAFLFNSLNDR